MEAHPSAPHVEALLRSALPLVDEIVGSAVGRGRCSAAEGDELRSAAGLKLVEDDYALLRQFRAQSTLKTYLSVIIQRLLIDQRRERWGVWRPSSVARRLGHLAVDLEVLLRRDGRPLEEAIEVLRAKSRDAIAGDDLRVLAGRLPNREPRPRATSLTAIAEPRVPAEVAVERFALAAERVQRARALQTALRDLLWQLPAREAVMLRMRYVDSFTVGRISEVLQEPAKPLYRRLERILLQLRTALQDRGFSAAEFEELLSDFAFDEPGCGTAGEEARRERA